MILYQLSTEKQLKKWLKTKLNLNFDKLPLTEIKTDLLFGDFIIAGPYKFKKVYSSYQCLETPEQKHSIPKPPYYKAENDKPKNFYKK